MYAPYIGKENTVRENTVTYLCYNMYYLICINSNLESVIGLSLGLLGDFRIRPTQNNRTIAIPNSEYHLAFDAY